MRDRAFASATELSVEIATGTSAASNCSTSTLAGAERHNPALNVIVWQVDQARERAHAADIDAVIADSADLIAAHGLDLETVRDVLAQDLAGAG